MEPANTDFKQGPTRESLRAVLRLMLRTDSEFDALCIDLFPTVAQRISAGMDRIQKENLLLLSYDTRSIIATLGGSKEYSERLAAHQQILNFSSDTYSLDPSEGTVAQVGHRSMVSFLVRLFVVGYRKISVCMQSPMSKRVFSIATQQIKVFLAIFLVGFSGNHWKELTRLIHPSLPSDFCLLDLRLSSSRKFYLACILCSVYLIWPSVYMFAMERSFRFIHYRDVAIILLPGFLCSIMITIACSVVGGAFIMQVFFPVYMGVRGLFLSIDNMYYSRWGTIESPAADENVLKIIKDASLADFLILMFCLMTLCFVIQRNSSDNQNDDSHWRFRHPQWPTQIILIVITIIYVGLLIRFRSQTLPYFRSCLLAISASFIVCALSTQKLRSVALLVNPSVLILISGLLIRSEWAYKEFDGWLWDILRGWNYLHRYTEKYDVSTGMGEAVIDAMHGRLIISSVTAACWLIAYYRGFAHSNKSTAIAIAGVVTVVLCALQTWIANFDKQWFLLVS